jgi:DNA-binding transcriptional LysR family regulator
VTPLLREDLVLLLPSGHPSSGGGELRLEQLRDAVWVTTRHGTAGATCLQRLCAEMGFEPIVSYRSNDYAVIRGFVRSGLGIALVPALGHAPDAGVVTARLAGTAAHRHVGVLTRADARNPAVDGVIAALDRSARGLHDPAAGTVHEPTAAALDRVRAVAVRDGH